MYTLIIKTIGEVALNSDMNSSLGYRYDVPLDAYGIPYIPLHEIINIDELSDVNIKMGFAYPEGYPCIVESVNNLKNILPGSIPYVRKEYTSERFVEGKHYSVRTIKSNLTFVGNISFDKSDYQRINSAISKVNRIGIRDDGITGEVSLNLIKTSDKNRKPLLLNPKREFRAIEISYLALTPICMYAPYEDGDKTLKYIPGESIYNSLRKNKDITEKIDLSDMIFSNAYLSSGGKRLLPTPICASVVKLDKQELRYRLSDGKDYSRVEQDVVLKDTFATDFDEYFMSYASPKVIRINVDNSATYDAMQSGQIYKGYIYGTDDKIRELVKYIFNKPFINVGIHTNKGYGALYCNVEQIKDKEIKTEYLSKRFDVLCVSDVHITNDYGMQMVTAESLLNEIEYVLGEKGALSIEGKYTDVLSDYAYNLKWNTNGAVTRCIKKGSVVRIAVKNDAIDISKIKHCFIGERTREGYGEIIAYPAGDEYYRQTQEMDIMLYDIQFGNNIRNIMIANELTQNVVTAYIREMIKTLASIDREDYKKGYSVDELTPIDLLKGYQNKYLSHIELTTLIEWYKEELLSED